MLRRITKAQNIWSGKIMRLSIATAMALFAVSCGEGQKTPAASEVKTEVRSQRYDKDLAAIDTSDIAAGVARLQPRYPEFQSFFLDTLMGFNVGQNFTNENPGIQNGLRIFLTYKDYRGVLDTVAKHYPDTKAIDDDLGKAFGYIKHYNPGYKAPQVIYMVSWLNNWGAFTLGDTLLCIGLDMFLGGSYPYYRSVGVPDYMTNKLTPDYIPVAAVRAIYQDTIPFNPEGATLLDMMIQRGKEMYYLEHVLPFVPEHVRLGYSKDQLEWCKANEAVIYNFFIRENLLYSHDWQKILRYVNEGPTSAGMPEQSPGNVGTWIGLQIVKRYAAEHGDMAMDSLLHLSIEPQTFLQQAKYKPKQ